MGPIADRNIAYGHIATQAVHVEVVEEKKVVRYTNTSVVESTVRNYFSDIPIMAEIARCESTFRHTMADGSVLRGVVDQADTGVMQINLRYHQKTANQLGLDLEDIYDNMAYARYLYERQGTQPWNASAPCWGNYLAANY